MKKKESIKWTDEMRSKIERPATLNDVEGTQGKKKIVWINDRPYVLKIEVDLENFIKDLKK